MSSKEKFLTEKFPESIKSSKFVSHRARMLGEFGSRKDACSTNFERILVKFQRVA